MDAAGRKSEDLFNEWCVFALYNVRDGIYECIYCAYACVYYERTIF